MIDYNQIAAFIAVADAGTFTGGADAIGIPKGSISRKIGLLEQSLGVRLFHRTTRKVTLTDIGEAYYRKCRPAFDQLTDANNLIDNTIARPKGILRIAAPAAFGSGAFADWVANYLDMYPEVQIEILLSDEYVDLVEHRVDLAFRFGEMQDSTLIARKLGTIRRVMCANPQYLEKRSAPHSLDDLADHQMIIHGSSLSDDKWSLISASGDQHRITIQPRLAVKSMDMVINAALAGLGIALVPEAAIRDHFKTGLLVPVLPEYTTSSQGFNAVYTSARHLSISVKAFLELVERNSLLGNETEQRLNNSSGL